MPEVISVVLQRCDHVGLAGRHTNHLRRLLPLAGSVVVL